MITSFPVNMGYTQFWNYKKKKQKCGTFYGPTWKQVAFAGVSISHMGWLTLFLEWANKLV